MDFNKPKTSMTNEFNHLLKSDMKGPVESLASSVIQEIASLLSAEDKVRLEEFSRALMEFGVEIDKRREKVGYHYNPADYNDRLKANRRNFENTLHRKVLTSDLKASYDRLKIVLKSMGINRQENHLKMIRGLLTDIVYESMDSANIIEDDTAQIPCFALNDYEKELYEKKNDKIKKINIYGPQLEEHESGRFIKFMKGLSLTNVRILVLYGSVVGSSLQNIIDIVRISGRGGIKSLSLSTNNLGIKFDKCGILQIIRAAGFAGVRSLDFSNNGIGGVFSGDDIDELFMSMQESGIRSAVMILNGYAGIREKIKEMELKYSLNISV